MARTSLPAIAAGESGLSRYLTEIRKFPMLAPDEEYMLAKRYKEHGDRDAAHRLVTSHLRLVAKIAMGYRGYGLPLSELITTDFPASASVVFKPLPVMQRTVVSSGRIRFCAYSLRAALTVTPPAVSVKTPSVSASKVIASTISPPDAPAK